MDKCRGFKDRAKPSETATHTFSTTKAAAYCNRHQKLEPVLPQKHRPRADHHNCYASITPRVCDQARTSSQRNNYPQTPRLFRLDYKKDLPQKGHPP